MPREVLTPGDRSEDDRPLAGFFGKLPLTGDFVTRGLPDAFRRHWDAWLTRHVAPLQRKGLVFPTGGLRFQLVSGGRAAAGVILSSQDSAGRHFPFSMLLIATGNLPQSQIDAWSDAALALLPDAADIDTLWFALDELPAPAPGGTASGPLLLWFAGQPAAEADALDPAAALDRLLAS